MNEMSLRFNANILNESFARTSVAAFIVYLNPSFNELLEVKTIVSEAVSNCIIHGYNYDESKYVYLNAKIENDVLNLEIIDYGAGIVDIELAKTPLYSTKDSEERLGMGLTIIENFVDDLWISSKPNEGTKLIVTKKLVSVREKVI